MHKVLTPDALVEVAEALISGNSDTRIFAIYGPMGVGKTTFIKAICKWLGSEDTASSPTYSIINHYLTATGQSIYHFDFYRIKNLEEAYNLGYEDYFFSGAWCFIEWPEKIESLLPPGTLKVFMEEWNGERIIRF